MILSSKLNWLFRNLKRWLFDTMNIIVMLSRASMITSNKLYDESVTYQSSKPFNFLVLYHICVNLNSKHWLLLLIGGNVCRKACPKKLWYLNEPGMSSGLSLCTRLQMNRFEFGKFCTKVPCLIFQSSEPGFCSGAPTLLSCKWTPWPGPCSVVQLHCNTSQVLKAVAGVFWEILSSIVAVFYFVLASHLILDIRPRATAAHYVHVMKLNLLQIRKRCKWPSAKTSRAHSNITAF